MNTDTQKEAGNSKTLIERLFAAGAHFGFTKSRRHPTVEPYLFGTKQGTDIIDLEKTEVLLKNAGDVLREAGKAGKSVLFVCTKEEIAPLVKSAAEKVGMPYVVNRWIGGMLTNFPEVRKRLQRLADLTAQGISGELERKYTKKERVVIGRELEKLVYNFDGIKTLDRLPSILVIVDPRHNAIAVEEAQAMHIPVVGITSSDVNLRNINHPVVMNDSLQASVTVVLEELTSALLAGKAEFTSVPKREEGGRSERTA